MRPTLTLTLVLIVSIAAAQTPFAPFRSTTLISPHASANARQPKNDLETMLYSGVRKSNATPIDSADVRKANDSLKDEFRLEYFDHLSANAVFIQNSQKMFPTISGEVINYKFSVWTQKIYEKEPDCTDCNSIKDKYQRRKCKEDARRCNDSVVARLREHILPFSIITKLSANYVDSSAGPTHDATSFFGAPLTFRFAPAADLTPYWKYNKLFVGLNADLRLLTIADTSTNKLQTSWGAYVSAGFSYLGKGYAYETDESDRHDGKFSFSAMLYWFKSGGEFKKAIFGDYEKKTLTGIELLLRFKTSRKEDSKFNLIFGANNGFRRGAPNFAQWQFQLGIGT